MERFVTRFFDLPGQSSFLDRLRQLDTIHRQRRALARLDERALADIGVTRAAAEKEANRPAWDAPENWRQ